MQNSAKHFSFFLVPDFSLVAMSCAIDVLRAANVEVGSHKFSWELVSEGTRFVRSSSQIEMPCTPLSEAQKSEVIVICGGLQSHLFHSERAANWFKTQARRGTTIGSISDGAYVAASVGLFDNCRSTIHWKCQSGYRERFPDLDIRTSLLEIDGNRFSCAGGTASLDLMLSFVVNELSASIAKQIAENYFHDVIRGDDQIQHRLNALRFATRDRKLSEALLMMEAGLENPIPLAIIANRLNISHRQLDRLFHRHLNISPSSHYRDMRLLRASALLKQTGLSVGEVAVSCGFHSASHLSKFFKGKFDKTPLQYRQN